MRPRSPLLVCTFLLALVVTPALAFDAHSRTPPDLTRLVVVGDSLSAGYQNGGLEDVQQVHGYANLVAQQAGVPLALPLIGAPGIPNVLQLKSWGPPPVIVRTPGTSPGRIDPLTQATDLAVPGQTVAEALSLRPNLPIDSATDLVLGLPGLLAGVSRSQVEWAEALHPTTILLWIGNNDALGAATAGNLATLTDVNTFRTSFNQVIRRLAKTGARLYVGTIPDVTAIPYLTSTEDLSRMFGVPLPVLQYALGIVPGDYVTLPGLDVARAILTGGQPGPLPADAVLDAHEVKVIRERTLIFNAIIAIDTFIYRGELVDVNGLLRRVSRNGIDVCGQTLTTAYLGGIFSLDGVHPTNTGYAVVANLFIHELDETGATIPPVDLCAVKAADPLVPPQLTLQPALPTGQLAAPHF